MHKSKESYWQSPQLVIDATFPFTIVFIILPQVLSDNTANIFTDLGLLH